MSIPRCTALLLFLAASTAANAQPRDFDDIPGTVVLRKLLMENRNIFDPAGNSLVSQPSAPTAAPAAPPTAPLPAPALASGGCIAQGERAYVSVRIQFALNSAQLRPEYLPGLARMAQLLREEPDLSLTIAGHTDISGGDAINLPLSAARAQTIAQELATRHGIDPRRLTVEGRGSRQLCRPDSPYAAGNRRVTFARR